MALLATTSEPAIKKAFKFFILFVELIDNNLGYIYLVNIYFLKKLLKLTFVNN